MALSTSVRNKHLTIYIDNAAVVAAFAAMGARDIRLSRIVLKIMSFCHNMNVKLNIQWIGTKFQLADGISRDLRVSEAKLRPHMRQLIMDWFRPNLDLFATSTNRLSKQIRFCSRYIEEGNTQTNGLAYEVSVHFD